MPRMVLHRTPVVVFHPVHRQAVACKRGDEIADNDALSTHPDFQWLFEDTPAPERVESVPIETTSAKPGTRRGTRRTRAAE